MTEQLDSDNNLHFEQPSLAMKVYNAAIVTAASASLVFEQSPANEALRINAGLDVLKSTGSATAVGLTIFGITAVIEGVSSGLITAGLHSNGGTVQKLKNRMQRKSDESGILDEKDSTQICSSRSLAKTIASIGTDTGIALGLGAGLVTVRHHVSDPEPTIKKDILTSAKATMLVSSVSGGIGYLAGGGIANAEKLGLETPAQYIIDYGTDTRFWMGMLAVGYGQHYARKGVARICQGLKSARKTPATQPIDNCEAS